MLELFDGYEIGERIVVTELGVDGLERTVGLTGVIIGFNSVDNAMGIQFDTYMNGHSCGGMGDEGFCRWCYNPKEVELVQEFEEELTESEDLISFISEFGRNK